MSCTTIQPKATSAVRRCRSAASTMHHTIGCCLINPRYYINDTGTGNTLNLSHPRVLQMVTDSLRYWVTEMHVDGFRFDLGTDPGARAPWLRDGNGFLQSCQQDPVLSQVKLIAEPWDIGPGGYQVGGFAPGWAEWNDKFRDTVRSFWKGDEGKLPDWRRGSRHRPMHSRNAAANPGPASTSSPRMTASRCMTWFPTMRSTTNRTARTARTATRITVVEPRR